MSNSFQQYGLSNAELNGLISRCKSIETQIDTVQEVVRTQGNHGTKQVA